MVSRRAALRSMAGALLGGSAGCIGDPRSAGTSTRTRTTTPAPVPSPTGDGTAADPPNWPPEWRRTVSEQHVLGLATDDGAIYATLSTESGPSAVTRLSPTDGAVAWRTELEGEAVAGSYEGYRPIARDKWGVTLTGDRVYSVTGAADSYDWTALNALDRASGERRWSLRRERRLAVRGVASRTVFATGLEFFEPEHSHDTPEAPLESVLYAIDAENGDVRWTERFAGVADVSVGTDASYVAARDGLVSLDHDGGQRWRFEAERPARAVRVADGRVYYLTEVGHDRSTVHGLDLEGALAWKDTYDVDEVLLDGDRLYAGGDVVLALDPDGAVAWRDDAHGAWLLLGPAGETLYTRVGGQAVGAYALPEGDELWTFDPRERYAWPAAATTETAVAEGYAAGRALYAVDRASGDALKRYDAGDRVVLFATASLDGRIFVGDNRSTISALDT